MRSIGAAAVALALLVASVVAVRPAIAADTAADLGLRVAPGFRITVYADHELANDIYAMTLDAQGRVVVTSQGWIKTLHDTQGTGKADKVTTFAATPTGGMGLCFDGNDLFFCGDGWLSVYRDKNGDGQADGPPERILPLAWGEHGGHAMRKGPDGWWYVIGGNDAGISAQHASLPGSPIKTPEAGAIVRLPPDLKGSEIVAQGFRNPYDFDFSANGDMFTYDSDCEGDYFLPWYSPTRIYHVGYAGHHGWRLPGYRRSWCRPDYYVDTVDILFPVGRGSPTGVTCYRHHQFPEHYRGGVFALDWTFGKVWFFPLEARGASYATKDEVFLESLGTHGFAPTDIAVAPDGSIFLTIGGRKTRGAVYHIEYVGEGTSPVKPLNRLDQVLQAPQPLDAWSRARWEPLARELGPTPFTDAVVDENRADADRVRAIEILTEKFGGVPVIVVTKVLATKSAAVQARLAWSLGRVPCEGFADALWQLASRVDKRTRCAAMSALADRQQKVDGDAKRATLMSCLGNRDKRVRQAAARLAAQQTGQEWSNIWKTSDKDSIQARLSVVLAALWRPKAKQLAVDDIISRAIGLHYEARESEVPLPILKIDITLASDWQLQAIRLIMIALGDFRLHDPSVEVYTGYSLAGPPVRASTGKLLAPLMFFPTTDPTHLGMEAARLLAMVEVDDPDGIASPWEYGFRQRVKCPEFGSSPTDDMHYLIVQSRMSAAWVSEHDFLSHIANVTLRLDKKLRNQQQRNKQNWDLRLAEVVTAFLKKYPKLADEFLKHPDFVRPGHVVIAAVLDDAHRQQAARLFLAAVKKDADFPFTGPLIQLLKLLPVSDSRPVFRERWEDLALRDALVLQLVTTPEEVDRDKFLAGLDSVQPNVVRACLTALEQLPRDAEPKHLVPLLRLLRRLQQEPKETDARAQTVRLIARQSGEPWSKSPGREVGSDVASLQRMYRPLFDGFTGNYPKLVASLRGDSEDPAVWEKLLQGVDWKIGDATRGAALFKARACVTCHAGAGRLGPDLNGVASRMARNDLFAAIYAPSRDVAPPYRVTVLETKAGQIHTGIVAFESADGVILQTGATTTLRLAANDIAARYPSTRSLMPDGLLKDMKPGDLADLYAYLQTLTGR
jgi:putative membrane-bound dehydrogenase-like protein